MTLGNRLYEMRRAKKMSQEQVAEALGVTRQTVSKWETDQTTPDFDKIIPLCELYNITTDELLKGKTEDKQTADNENYNMNNNYYNSYDTSDTFDKTATEQSVDTDNELMNKYRKRSAMLIAVAVCMYILSVIPFFLFDNSKLMMSIFFVIIAVATMLIVFGAMSKPKKAMQTEKQTKETKLLKTIDGILSGIILVIYMLVSFTTGAWHITWLLWVIYGILCEIVKLIFSLKEDKTDEK